MSAQSARIPMVDCRRCGTPNPDKQSVCQECGDWVEDSVKVVFRASRPRAGSPFSGFHDVFAMFPEVPGDTSGNTCQSYAHIGQHCSADYRGMIHETDPATPEQYAGLFRELENIGYRLEVIQKATPAMTRTRKKHAFLT